VASIKREDFFQAMSKPATRQLGRNFKYELVVSLFEQLKQPITGGGHQEEPKPTACGFRL